MAREGQSARQYVPNSDKGKKGKGKKGRDGRPQPYFRRQRGLGFRRVQSQRPKSKEDKLAAAAWRNSPNQCKRRLVSQMNKVAKEEIELYDQFDSGSDADSSDSSDSDKNMDGTLVPIQQDPPEKLPLSVHFGSPCQSTYTLNFDIPELQCIDHPKFEKPSDAINESGNLPEKTLWRCPEIWQGDENIQ